MQPLAYTASPIVICCANYGSGYACLLLVLANEIPMQDIASGSDRVVLYNRLCCLTASMVSNQTTIIVCILQYLIK